MTYCEDFHCVDRSCSFGERFNAYSPYAEEFGYAPGDTEIADEFLARMPDPVLSQF